MLAAEKVHFSSLMDLAYQILSKGINVIRSDKQRVIFSQSNEPGTET